MECEGGHAVVLVAVESLVGWVRKEGREPFARSITGEIGGIADFAIGAELVAIDASKLLDDDLATGGHALVEIGIFPDVAAGFVGNRIGDVVDLLLQLG